MLNQLTAEERLHLTRCYVEGSSYARAYRRFQNERPEAYAYNHTEFNNYRQSDLFQGDLRVYVDALRENPEGTLLTQRPDRIQALSDLFKSCLEMIREKQSSEDGITVNALTRLSSEARGLLCELRKESEPYDEARTVEARSPWDEFAKAEVKKRKLSEEVEEAILSDDEPN